MTLARSRKSSAKEAQYNCVSLFSGAGGLDIGFERAGFHTVSLTEFEPAFARTLEANKGRVAADSHRYLLDAAIFNSDIRTLSGSELACGRSIDCVIGGPPCQAFSSAGKQLSVLDERGRLVDEYCRIIEELKPRALLFENVRGLVTARDEHGQPGGVLRSVFGRLQDLGYSCRADLLNAADFGAPQRRVRCFIIGVRHGVAPQFPVPTHGGNGLFSGQPHFTLGEFLSKDAEQDESKFVYPTEALGRELAKLPNGSGLKSAGVAEPTRPGGHWGYRQGTFIADLTKPARTVTGSASQDWVRWNGVLRRLTFSEVVKLQGFPPDWNFCGNSAQIFKQVGNAVPPIFGEMLGKVLRAHLDQNSSSPPQRNELPTSLTKYVEYTVADERKNGSARRVHKAFEGSKR